MKSSPKMQQKTILRAVEAQPHLDLDKGQETQPWGTLTDLPISLSEETRMQSIEALNQLLADTISLRDMYKKHHWQVSGPTFYQLHLLFDKHFRHEAMHLVDPALVELPRETKILPVGLTGRTGSMRTGPAHGRNHQVARLELGVVGTDFHYFAKGFVAEDQEF